MLQLAVEWTLDNLADELLPTRRALDDANIFNFAGICLQNEKLFRNWNFFLLENLIKISSFNLEVAFACCLGELFNQNSFRKIPSSPQLFAFRQIRKKIVIETREILAIKYLWASTSSSPHRSLREWRKALLRPPHWDWSVMRENFFNFPMTQPANWLKGYIIDVWREKRALESVLNFKTALVGALRLPLCVSAAQIDGCRGLASRRAFYYDFNDRRLVVRSHSPCWRWNTYKSCRGNKFSSRSSDPLPLHGNDDKKQSIPPFRQRKLFSYFSSARLRASSQS